MTVSTHLRFRTAAPLLVVATAMVASFHARADGGNRFAQPRNVMHPLPVNSMHLTPRTCEIDQSRPRPHDPLEPRALPLEQARPVILDGVMYLVAGRGSGAVGVRGAPVSQCSVHPNAWEFGVIQRHVDSPRYY